MKKALILAVTAMMIACSTETYEFVGTRSDVQVSFSGQIQTRVTGDSWDALDEVGIFMFQAGQTLSNEVIVDDAFNRKYVYSMDNAGFEPDAGIDKMYYPVDGAVDFIAYYPFGNIEDGGIYIDTYNQVSQQELDLLYSNNLKNISATAEPQSLQFKHQLSKVLFTLTPGEGVGMEDLSGLTLTIEGVKTQAFFSLADGTINIDAEAPVQDVKGLVTESEDKIQVEAILIPQQCAGLRIFIRLENGRTYVFSFSENSEWMTGNKYLYEVELSNSITEATLKSEIVGWTENPGTLKEDESYFEIIPWDGSIDTDWYSVDATTMSISTAAELAGLAHLVNTGTDFTGKTIHQTLDIDLNNLKWTPIGCNSNYAFKGTYDGNSFLIKNANPVPTEGASATESIFAGLFGVIDDAGKVTKTVVYGGYFVHNTVANIINFGGICGMNNGTISDCRNYAAIVSSCNISSSAQSGPYVGGIAGVNNGIVTGCDNYADLSADNLSVVSSTYLHLGGIVGANTGTISDCENIQNLTASSGQVRIGGITGLSSGKTSLVEKCVNQGKVSMPASHNEASCGGIVGKNSGGATIKSSINKGEVIAKQTEGSKLFAGGVAAYNSGGAVNSCENHSKVSAVGVVSAKSAAAAGGIVGYNIGVTITAGENTENFTATIHQSSNLGVVSATGAVYNYTGGIAGFNKESTEESLQASIFSCNENQGTPIAWIGNATSGDLIDHTSHTHE